MGVDHVSSKTESNRDKALRGEVVLVTKGRLREMQLQASALEGVGEGAYHWHWSAVLNELIARRSGALPAHETSSESERLALEFRLASQQAAQLRDDRDQLRMRHQEAFRIINAATYYVPQPRQLHAEMVAWLNGASKQEASPEEPSATPSAGPSGNTRTVDTSAGCKPAGGVAVKATASLPACECLVRDKSPSAYHNVKCPRYVADAL